MNLIPMSQTEALIVLLARVRPAPWQLAGDAAQGPSSSAGALQGLCVNCDHRDYCSYPKPAGGVWSCGEYV